MRMKVFQYKSKFLRTLKITKKENLKITKYTFFVMLDYYLHLIFKQEIILN